MGKFSKHEPATSIIIFGILILVAMSLTNFLIAIFTYICGFNIDYVSNNKIF